MKLKEKKEVSGFLEANTNADSYSRIFQHQDVYIWIRDFYERHKILNIESKPIFNTYFQFIQYQFFQTF